jgi:D-alanyl-D-alanine carboxypeptidase
MTSFRQDTARRRRWRGGKVAQAALALILAAGATQAADCPDGSIAIGSDCVEVDHAADQIRQLIHEAINADDLEAVIVSVKVGKVPVLTEAWGESMTGLQATPDMHFRNGAVAIAYLATVLLQLEDRGLISLDDKLSKWFPQYRRSGEVTLRMLINCTSGYGDYVDLKTPPADEDLARQYDDVFRQWTPDELISIGLGQPMACNPGTCFNYAHTNFVILGEVLRKATGKPVEELLRDGILAPLALDDTRSESTAVIQEPVLHAFTAERGVYEDSTYWNPSWTLARGAIMTTNIDDLLTSAIAIGSGSLVSPEAHKSMIAPLTAQFPPFNDDVYYGLGILVTNSWMVQTPSFAGYAAAMAYLPAKEIGIAVTATLGPNGPTKGRPTDALFAKIGAYLVPDQAPIMP